MRGGGGGGGRRLAREGLVRVRTFLFALGLVVGFLLVMITGHLGPWLVDQDYFPPHLTWDGTGTMASSVTVNFRTPEARCGVEYRVVYPDGSSGPASRVDEPSAAVYHHVTLGGLEPGTTYSYSVLVLDDPPGGALDPAVLADLGTPHQFTTAPDPGSGKFAFKFVVFGDNRPNVFGTGQTARVSRAIASEPGLSFVVNTGDVVLMGGGPKYWWRRYFMENAYMRDLVTLPTKGNHEVFGVNDPTDESEFEFNHAFPGNQNWYSFNYSNAHFISLEFTDYKEGPVGEGRDAEMREWLRGDLARVNDTDDVRWVFVTMHYPMQTLLGGNGVNAATWERICGVEFRRARVVPDVFFTGHVHDYERGLVNLGDYDGDGADDHAWNVVTGGGGAEIAPARWTPVGGDYEVVEL
ncbi:MAG: purple acid phosphatase family protein, partial [Promethearchaeota archaeon]